MVGVRTHTIVATSEAYLASERRGIWSVLNNPVVYEGFHQLIGARRWLKRFTRDVVQAQAGDCVLDIGCGPAALLRYLPHTTYIGFDRNEAYIARAQRNYTERGRFICDDISNFAKYDLSEVDIAVAIGVIHHLDDALALSPMREVARTLRPGGRFLTVDPCFHPEQSFVQRFIVSSDRGMHVRPFERYVELCSTIFPTPKTIFQRGHFPFPHSICILDATIGRK